MGRSYQAEPWVQDHFDALLQRKLSAEVGLLVGKEAVGARDFILGLVPTPQQEGQDVVQCTTSGASAAASAGKGKKAAGQSSGAAVTGVSLDVAWIGQHAEQVARMLPGGMCLLGCYLFCSDAGYQSCTPQLCAALQHIQRIRTMHAAGGAGPELLLVHAESSTRKVTARCAPAPTPTPSGLTIAELKWAPCAANLMQLTCSWPIDCELPAPSTTSSLQHQAEGLVKHQCAAISNAVGTLQDSTIPVSDALLLDVLPPAPTKGGTASGITLPACPIQLLPLQGLGMPGPGVDGGGGQAGPVATSGCGRLKGSVCGLAVVHKRQPWASAVQELQADMCSSLRVRVELLVEDALSWQEEQQQQQQQGEAVVGGVKGGEGQGKAGGARAPQHPLLTDQQPLARPFASGLPRRVALPALGGLPVCDYLLPGEGVGEAVARAVDMLGPALGSTDADKLEQQVTVLETEAEVAKKLLAWTPGLAVRATAVAVSGASGHGPAAAQCGTTLLGGAAVGVAMAVAALAVMFSNLNAQT